MKFSSKEDIEAPVDTVFDLVSDFEGFERAVVRRGADLTRKTDLSPIRPGLGWTVKFKYRGRPREMDVVLRSYDRPNGMVFDFEGSGLTGVFALDLVALSRRRTRMSLGIELKPQTLSARLLIQSLKLAKSNLDKRFKLRVADYAKDLEDRAARMNA